VGFLVVLVSFGLGRFLGCGPLGGGLGAWRVNHWARTSRRIRGERRVTPRPETAGCHFRRNGKQAHEGEECPQREKSKWLRPASTLEERKKGEHGEHIPQTVFQGPMKFRAAQALPLGTTCREGSRRDPTCVSGPAVGIEIEIAWAHFRGT
jgi:hypothetical protein